MRWRPSPTDVRGGRRLRASVQRGRDSRDEQVGITELIRFHISLFDSRTVCGLTTEQYGLLGELQNGSHRAQNDQAVDDRLKESALLFLRVHK